MKMCFNFFQTKVALGNNHKVGSKSKLKCFDHPKHFYININNFCIQIVFRIRLPLVLIISISSRETPYIQMFMVIKQEIMQESIWQWILITVM
jgi:hypothetical protein